MKIETLDFSKTNKHTNEWAGEQQSGFVCRKERDAHSCSMTITRKKEAGARGNPNLC